MATLIEVIQEQNRLLAEQNRLLREATIIEAGAGSNEESAGMMTDRDLQLILMSDNILAAIDRWNKKCGHGRSRSLNTKLKT